MMRSYRHCHHRPMKLLMTWPAMDMVDPYGRPQVMALDISPALCIPETIQWLVYDDQGHNNLQKGVFCILVVGAIVLNKIT
ncbi:hypothetical protein HU200_028911 [Digitaria exilis]|uniref:Uncharacterized protein n=1 Tax=Digitaria exilis TaxID=1010633 RepID=A0A835BV10_9POAL|nr:hypothetical protein HU200_028911 [Digitaria exilis]